MSEAQVIPDYPAAWIAVTDRMPEAHTRVLISLRDANTTDGWAFLQCAYVDGYGNFWADDRRTGAAPAKTTHWMPLPEPPK